MFTIVPATPAVLAPGLVLLLMLPATALQFPLSTFYRRLDYRRQRTLPVRRSGMRIRRHGRARDRRRGLLELRARRARGNVGAGGRRAARISVSAGAALRAAARCAATSRFSAPLLIAGLAVLAMFQVIYLVGHRRARSGGPRRVHAGRQHRPVHRPGGRHRHQHAVPGCVRGQGPRTELLSEIFVKSNRLSLMWAVPFGVGLALFASDLVHFVLGDEVGAGDPRARDHGDRHGRPPRRLQLGAFVKARGITWPIAVSGCSW